MNTLACRNTKEDPNPRYGGRGYLLEAWAEQYESEKEGEIRNAFLECFEGDSILCEFHRLSFFVSILLPGDMDPEEHALGIAQAVKRIDESCLLTLRYFPMVGIDEFIVPASEDADAKDFELVRTDSPW